MSEEHKYGARIVRAGDGDWDVLTDTYCLCGVKWIKNDLPAGGQNPCGGYYSIDDAMECLDAAPPPPDYVKPKEKP